MKEVIQPLDETLGLVRSAIQTALASDSTKTAVDWLGAQRPSGQMGSL